MMRIERITTARAELEAEQNRLNSVFRKGYITEQEFDEQVERIRAELFSLPVSLCKILKDDTSGHFCWRNIGDGWLTIGVRQFQKSGVISCGLY